ncbi:hypothetical protein KIPB_006409 [Kipferlia bialata]|uniref:Lipid-binding serum glycoprotein C-terminal domain-containing protein n=1 Tax=Kipferlia bialata TaxID=797122 RepID=A0A9K3GJ35_9EUKA|nr:hypothetical protein KIPB_006409 [Kipferlia bialata]|eukprot:g6409.t1
MVSPGFQLMDNFVGVHLTEYGFPTNEGETWQPKTKPAPLPSIVNDADVQMIVSNNAFNTIYSSVNHNGQISGTISPSTVANPMFESYLSTSVLASMCPEVYAQYPSSGVSLEMSASIDPTLTFMPSAGFLNITGTVEVSVNSDPASDVYDTEVFELGVSYGLAMTPRVWQTEHTTWTTTSMSWSASMYNSTAWEVSSEYGPVAVDSPQAHQLLAMLGAIGVAPFVTDMTTDNAPEWMITGDYYDYDNQETFFDGATTFVVAIPLNNV